MWYAVVDSTTGRLESVGQSKASDERLATRGLETIELAGEPNRNEMWDEATRAFVPRPPKIRIDRVDELLADPSFARLTPRQERDIRARLESFLGPFRWRSTSSPPDLGTETDA